MEDGLKMFPQYHSARAALGRDYFLKGMMHEARTHIVNATERSIDNAMAQRLKLKLDIVFNDPNSAISQLDLMKKLFPDDDFTKSIRDLLIVNDWEACKALIQCELDRLEIRWTSESQKNDADAALERLQTSMRSPSTADWELPSESNSIQSNLVEIVTPAPVVKNFDENNLPAALRSGHNLAFIRGEDERYLALKGFRRIQSEGLFLNKNNDNFRRNSLDATTLAEIYVAQGLTSKAVAIYERLAQQHPDIAHYQSRASDLQLSLKNNSFPRPLPNGVIEPQNPLLERASRITPEQERKLNLLQNLLAKLDAKSTPSEPTDR
jgi:tetratricopeptide (TPR) repeat protein